jgi:menaquinone-dependent protoporphyrinogen oxidase
MAEAMDRREFVKLSACAGVGVAIAGTVGCSSQDSEAVETPSFQFGEESEMGKRVLVAYATGRGSTVGVAKAIGEELGKAGYAADVQPMSSATLDGHDAAVIGSAINGGAWLPAAVRFVERNADALSAMPVAAFAVHGMNAGNDAGQTVKRKAYLAAVRKQLKLTAEGYFLGDVGEMGGIAKFAFKAFGGAGEGDMRDWDKIRKWAGQLTL